MTRFYTLNLFFLAGLIFLTPVISNGQTATTITNLRGPVLSDKTKLKRGQEAIYHLGARLPDVAKRNGLDPGKLRHLLTQDKDLWVDASGQLLYLCEFLPASQQDRPRGPEPKTARPHGAIEPLNQTFALHSRPGSTKKIYLDFNGHTMSQNQWPPEANISAPYDLDGNPGSFTNIELERIQYCWQRVAEDYIGFDVDVTTEDPGAAALIRSDQNDIAFGQRIIITSTPSWYSGAQGIAYFYTFGGNTEVPCFVFSEYFTHKDEKALPEICSHESGHTFGLNHDGAINGANGPNYFFGSAGWAPIMGNSEDHALSQWSRGEYGNANNREDDLELIAALTGYADDDIGNTHLEAVPLTGENAIFTATGLIGRSTDADVFSFSTAAGTIYLNVEPQGAGADGLGANLDTYAVLLNADGDPIASANPDGSLSSLIKATLPAGTYYLRVSGSGQGNPNAGGYSRYGSLGNYRVRVSAVASAPGNPVITSEPAVTGMTDRSFNYTIQATNGPTSFSAALPAGLSLDAATGLISGKPVVAGNHNATISATNSYGTASVNLVITVLPGLGSSPGSSQVLGPYAAEGRVGRLFTYQINATGNPTQFGGVLLPPTLSVNTGTGLVSGIPTEIGNYDSRLYASNDFGMHIETVYIFINEAPIRFSGKVLLQGAYRASSGIMHTTLNSSGALQSKAMHQPYAVNYNYQGSENVSSAFFAAHPDIVDWVLIELRSYNGTAFKVAGTRAAFVKQDGTLVETDGVSTEVSFPGVPAGQYAVVIRHRNHLAIRSATALNFTTGLATYDFTTGSNKSYQNQNYPSTVQAGSVWLMRGGNANADPNVKVNGPRNDQNQIMNIKLKGSLATVLSNQYAPEDLNMDGTVKTNGPNNDENFLLNSILGGLLSQAYVEQL